MSFLNLPYIAAATPPEYEVRIIDEEYEEIDFESNPWLVALSAQTPVAPRAYDVARLFREKGVKTVMGGVHASTLPQEALQYVDAVIIGEGEFVWKDVLSDLEKGTLKDIYIDGEEFTMNGNRVRLELVEHTTASIPVRNDDSPEDETPPEEDSGSPDEESAKVIS